MSNHATVGKQPEVMLLSAALMQQVSTNVPTADFVSCRIPLDCNDTPVWCSISTCSAMPMKAGILEDGACGNGLAAYQPLLGH